MTDSTPRKPKTSRSPNYPSLDLSTALRRAEQLYQREGRNFAPVSAVVEAWDYSPKSSGGRLAVAALKRFGLLEDRGSLETREARLTDVAQAIILDEREDSTDRLRRIREVALMPPIHREVLDKYQGQLPSDSTLRYYLTVERDFSPAGAAEFIGQFRKTLAFSQLPTESATVLHEDEGSGDTEDEQDSPAVLAPPILRPRGTIRPPAMTATGPPPIQFPVSGGTVVIQTTAPLTETAWDQMMEVLKTLKPAMVVKSADSPAPPLDKSPRDTPLDDLEDLTDK